MDAVKLLSSLLKNNSMGSNVLGGLLGGGSEIRQSGGGGGGLGALAGMLGGGGEARVAAVPVACWASLLGGGNSGGGGGGGLGALAGMLGGGAKAAGGLLGKLMGGGDEQQAAAASSEVPQEANQEAELLIRAMCNAAKADGRLDDAEKQNIIGRLGDEVTQDEIDFVQGELSAPLDIRRLCARACRKVPDRRCIPSR